MIYESIVHFVFKFAVTGILFGRPMYVLKNTFIEPTLVSNPEDTAESQSKEYRNNHRATLLCHVVTTNLNNFYETLKL